MNFLQLLKFRQPKEVKPTYTPVRPLFYYKLFEYFADNYSISLTDIEVTEIISLFRDKENKSPTEHFACVWDYFKEYFNIELSFLEVFYLSKKVENCFPKKEIFK